ncbi:MAG: hypothetical protein Q9170_002260 [Blastenia crenularia]
MGNQVGKELEDVKNSLSAGGEVDIHPQNKQMYSDILELEEELEQREKLITDLQLQLRVEMENSKKIKESASMMQYAMESKELFVGRQDSDDTIYSQFQTMIGQIKTWSVPFAQGRPILQREFSTAAIDHIRRVAPRMTNKESLESFLTTPKNMRLFVRGYVGFAIADQLFRSLPHSSPGSYSGFHGTDVWMDQRLVQPVSVLEEALLFGDRSMISLREFHDWRVLTTTLASRLDASSKTGKGMESYVTRCCEHIMGLVGQWVGQRDRNILEEDLLAILFSAVGSLASSRDPVLFDREIMEDKHGEEDSDGEDVPTADGKRVEILISPALFKRGNTDGERFEFESCIERAEVKCE